MDVNVVQGRKEGSSVVLIEKARLKLRVPRSEAHPAVGFQAGLQFLHLELEGGIDGFRTVLGPHNQFRQEVVLGAVWPYWPYCREAAGASVYGGLCASACCHRLSPLN